MQRTGNGGSEPAPTDLRGLLTGTRSDPGILHYAKDKTQGWAIDFILIST